MGGYKGDQGRRGGRVVGGVYFYFNGKSEEEDTPSESDDDLDLSEDEWGKE